MSKTLEEMEQERLDRLVFGGGQKAVKPFQPPPPKPVAQEPAPAPARTWSPRPVVPAAQPAPQKQPQQPRAWEIKKELVGHRLEGNMDLSTRISYLNSLMDQGSITEEEYQARAEPIRVASTIINACIEKDVNGLRGILQENPNFDIDTITEQGATPLSVAVNLAHSELCTVLLTHGAQVEKKKDGFTPLITLCTIANIAGATECARTLIRYRADVTANAISKNGSTVSCISAAVEANAPAEFIKILCEAGAGVRDEIDGVPLLNHCIIEEKPEQAIVLLAYGADPNGREPSKGVNCLASAINSGYLDVVKALLGRGANTSLPIMRDQSVSGKDLAKHLASQGGVHAQIAALF